MKVAGRWTYLYRAVDQFGQVIDVLASERRDLATARRFFIQALSQGRRPVEVTTDRATSYPRVLGACSSPPPTTSTPSTQTTRSKATTAG